MLIDYCLHAAQFTVQPVSVVQAEGLEAMFECFHPESISSWFVNGVYQTNNNFPFDILPLAGTPASLTIPARPDYNNTVVQCRAVVEVGGRPEIMLSDNAMLTVLVSHVRVCICWFCL